MKIKELENIQIENKDLKAKLLSLEEYISQLKQENFNLKHMLFAKSSEKSSGSLVLRQKKIYRLQY